jgi:CMP-N-acetylneuraminic acid synthetase
MSCRILAVVPARGGSKSVPKKNIAPLANKPLIAYTLESARQSKRLTQTIVSTDCADIAEVVRSLGGDVPFMRPENLSGDMALSLPVIQHAVMHMETANKKKFDFVVMLQPTSPFRTAGDIDECINLLIESGADSAISVVNVGANHPLRMKRVVATNHLVNYVDQGMEDMRPRQSLPPVYIRNGAIYAARRETLMEHNSFVGDDCRAYIMPKDRSINIDTEDDLIIAEHYIQKYRR